MLFKKRRYREEKVLLYRQLGMMLTLGLSVEAALAQVEPGSFKSLSKPLQALQSDIAAGTPTQSALGQHPLLFGDFAFDRLAPVATARQLGRAFVLAADQLEEAATLIQRIQRIFWYPAATTVFALAVLLMLCIFVLPAYATMFADFGSSLPSFTQAILDIGELIRSLGLLIVLLLIVGTTLLMRRKALLLGLIRRLPMFGPLLVKMQCYLFAKQLAALLQAGFPLDTSTRFSAQAIHFAALEKVLAGTPTPLESGGTLRSLLDQAEVYPKMLRKVLSLTTDDNGISEVMVQAADYSAAETERAQHQTLFITEISILMVLGFLVGSTVIAMYLPIFKLSGAVGG